MPLLLPLTPKQALGTLGLQGGAVAGVLLVLSCFSCTGKREGDEVSRVYEPLQGYNERKAIWRAKVATNQTDQLNRYSAACTYLEFATMGFDEAVRQYSGTAGYRANAPSWNDIRRMKDELDEAFSLLEAEMEKKNVPGKITGVTNASSYGHRKD